MEGPPCKQSTLDIALSWYSRAKSLRTPGFDSGIIIDELRLREFGEKVLKLDDENNEILAMTVANFAYVETAFSKDPDWEWGEPIPEEKEADNGEN